MKDFELKAKIDGEFDDSEEPEEEPPEGDGTDSGSNW